MVGIRSCPFGRAYFLGAMLAMSVSGSVSRVNSSCHVMEILLMERLPAPIAIIYRVSYIPGDFLGFLP